MRVIMSCGGTGGHIMPALAVADMIKENSSSAEILFVGGERGMERRLVEAAGYPIECLPVRGLSRSLSPDNLRVLWELRGAVKKAKALIARFAPDIVIGTGGYACYPTLRAAADMGVPTAVHESNAVPGLAVRRLSSRMDRVWVNFADTADKLPHATVRVVGNPIRCRCGDTPVRKKGVLHVLSFGGSLGATELNRAVVELMKVEQKSEKIRHLHASGRAHFDVVAAAMEQAGLLQDPRFELLPFIEDMPSRLARADLVISRAGAMSISELALWGKAAILIPSPNVTGNHQYKNARLLADAGAAYLIEERELASGALTAAVSELLQSADRRRALSRAITAFATPDANRLIWQDIRTLVRK
ncbi:MAG: UDP-N-acetylglucosamine--N-acetylmuramyl-(pentapeptide) pyrophosphoryl-undecaprenol N-acetylglucosamine transferase [Clostridia bacterium]|nr:UDP-N-acetylglucosamine--N-acetylmuramyl-(pentapeptide) pyrophosphoryl-undecaprenol N-acetylglucosamine transferase [Clostridia bacterium]